MSTTRIIFIIICVVLAVVVFTIGVLIQKNDPESKYSLTNALKPRAFKKTRSKPNVFRNTGTYITMFLLIIIVALFLTFSRR